MKNIIGLLLALAVMGCINCQHVHAASTELTVSATVVDKVYSRYQEGTYTLAKAIELCKGDRTYLLECEPFDSDITEHEIGTGEQETTDRGYFIHHYVTMDIGYDNERIEPVYEVVGGTSIE